MDIVSKAKAIAIKEAEKLNLIIEEVEWVKENDYNILRIIADKDGGLDINDATNLNERISEVLDQEDFISDEYMLEVSSPGAERELKQDSEIAAAIDEYVHIDFINPIMITKDAKILDCEGYLSSVSKEDEKLLSVTVNIHIKGRIKKLEIERQNIKFIRKAIKF